MTPNKTIKSFVGFIPATILLVAFSISFYGCPASTSTSTNGNGKDTTKTSTTTQTTTQTTTTMPATQTAAPAKDTTKAK